MNGHAHADRRARRPGFCGQGTLQDQRRGYRVARVLEHGEDAVAFAFAFDDMAVLASNARIDNGIVASQSRTHAARLTLPETRAGLDIGQQEGDHPRGQRARRVHSLLFGTRTGSLKSEPPRRCRSPQACPRMLRLEPGGVAEWLMATVCKTVRRKSYAGSNPAPTTLNQVCAAQNRGSLCQPSYPGVPIGVPTRVCLA